MTRGFTGWHMAFTMASFFGVIIGVNVVLAIFASKSWTGLVVTNSYVASQNFNRDAKAARLQHARGWQLTSTVDRGRVLVTILDRANRPVTGLLVSAVLQRPTTEAEDEAHEFQEMGAGKYGSRKAIRSGVWLVDIIVRHADGGPMRFVQRVFVKEAAS
jgi:nitrogen fixation protein FixH